MGLGSLFNKFMSFLQECMSLFLFYVRAGRQGITEKSYFFYSVIV